LGSQPRFSPDGRRIAINGVQIVDLTDCTIQQVTSEGYGMAVSWSPDGRQITYSATRSSSDGWDLYYRPADGSGAETVLVTAPWNQISTGWVPDGRSAFYLEARPHQGTRVNRDIVTSTAGWLWRWDVQAGRATRLNADVPLTTNPALSPDGQWMAFGEWEGDRKEIGVARLSGGSLVDKWRVATDGATAPLWSPEGDVLFYRRGAEVVAVRVEFEPTFRVLGEEVLFDGPYADPIPGVSPMYDIDPNEERFVMVRVKPTSPEVHVVFNWFAELEQRLEGNR
jgi:Tol biopolymer transport system component